MKFPGRGFNECLIMYMLAASGEHYPVVLLYTIGDGRKQFLRMAKNLSYQTSGDSIMEARCFSQYSFLGLT